MKKCAGCEQDIDKYAIACQYCGKLLDLEKQARDPNRPPSPPKKGGKGKWAKGTAPF